MSLTRTEAPKIPINTVLNNLEVSSEYILKLRKEMEIECKKIFSGLEPKVVTCLDELTETSTAFKKMLQVK